MDVICIFRKDITTFTIKINHMIKMILCFTAKIHTHTHTNLQTNKPSAQMLEKRKDKQIQDLEHKNESLQQEMSVKRHTNIDTIQDFEDTYYHRGLIVLDDLEKEGYYTFHCNICEYAFWEGASKCYEDQQAHQQHCLQPFR
eukprot:610770_1